MTVSAPTPGPPHALTEQARSWMPPWPFLASVAAGWAVAAELGCLSLDRLGSVSVWWPATGVLLGALLAVEPRRWAAVVLAALLGALPGGLARGTGGWLVLAFFSVNALHALLTAALVRRLAGPRPSLSRLRHAVAVAVLPAVVAAALALPPIAAASLGVPAGPPGAILVFLGGSTLGATIAGAAILAWTGEAGEPPLSARDLLLVAVGALVAIGAVRLVPSHPLANEILAVPPLLWIAFRFGPRGAALALAAVATATAPFLASRPTLAGIGPILRVEAAQVVVATVAGTVLLLAAAAEERRRATRALARSRDLFQSFFSSAPVGVFVKDEERRGIFYSRWMEELVGLPTDALLGRTVAELVPGPAGERLLGLEGEAVTTGRTVRVEIPLGDRSFLEAIFPIPRADGKPYVGGFVVDVSDRVRAETALRESEARLRLVEAALDHASDAVCVHDEEGRCVWANVAMARALDRRKEDLLGAAFSELRPGGGAAAWRALWDEVSARGTLVREMAIPAQGGRTVPGEVASSVVAYAGRRYLVSSARDVSDRRQAEASARLAGLGTVAAGVAHEINNPLSYVLSNLAWLQERIESARTEDLGAPLEEARRVLEEARDGAQRVREIVAQLRAFSRPQDRTGPVDVAAAARSALAIVQNEVRHRAQLVTRLEEVPPVAGNETRLAQVILNLLTNAAQAIPPGRADRNVILLAVRPGDSPGDVTIEVADSGPGIPYEARSKLFEPFYSTKPVGSGTGLGLFICHGIVSEMGGRIEVESVPGEGATFRVVLPAVAPTPSAPAPSAPAPAPRRARLLVLDDDERVANALRRILERDHDVEVTTDPAAALQRVREGSSWDVVFCDLMMPDMTGMEWFEEAAKLRPDLAPRIVFVTGGAFTEAARDFLDRIPNARLEKPFVADEVRTLVAERVAS